MTKRSCPATNPQLARYKLEPFFTEMMSELHLEKVPPPMTVDDYIVYSPTGKTSSGKTKYLYTCKLVDYVGSGKETPSHAL